LTAEDLRGRVRDARMRDDRTQPPRSR
jgi:hypothetical protein